MSARQVAERLDTGMSTAIVWVKRYRQNGEAVAGPLSKPGDSGSPHTKASRRARRKSRTSVCV